MQESQNLAFSVDSHLLRELGALLVGRDSTALLELIKNSYDADATLVLVEATDLGQDSGAFTIVDNGTGMTLHTFKDAFLRIAGRSKEGGDRRSRRFGRRYTGAKGIGRLSAHKLASTLEVTSIPWVALTSDLDEDAVGVSARLAWDEVENDTTDITEVSSALTATPVTIEHGVPSGTSMQLRGLRGSWSSRRVNLFLEEIRSCRPAHLFTSALGSRIVPSPLLFDEPRLNDHGPGDPGFVLELGGDLGGSEELWQTLGADMSWVLEIDSTPQGIRYAIGPTQRTVMRAKDPVRDDWFSLMTFERPHPNSTDGPFFQARIFMREGSIAAGTSPKAIFERRESGVRVFLEGFRVVPYGSPGDDWLNLDSDYVRKRREFPNEFEADLPTVENEGYVQVGNRSYYGAVFLTEAGAPLLQAVVNREGFVPDAYFESLRDTVRTGIDLVTRTRAALNRRAKEVKDEAASRDAAAEQAQAAAALAASQAENEPLRDEDEDPSNRGRAAQGYPDTAHSDFPNAGIGAELGEELGDGSGPRGSARELHLNALVSDARALTNALRVDVHSPASELSLSLLESYLDELQGRLQLMGDEQLRLRTLASVGTQFGSFIHEINGLLGQAETVRALIEGFVDPETLSRAQRRSLRLVRESADELLLSLTRQASYLTDVLGADSRRRRTRMPVRERVDSALRLLIPRIAERNQRLINDVSDDLRTPPIFSAELAIVVTNLVSNATKFAGDGGQIRVDAGLDEAMTLHLVVENTGIEVRRDDWDRFFRPFESTTTDVDVVLGQGMGLGLPIVRNIAEEYEGAAQFTVPTPGFSTAIEVLLPDPRPDKARRRA